MPHGLNGEPAGALRSDLDRRPASILGNGAWVATVASSVGKAPVGIELTRIYQDVREKAAARVGALRSRVIELGRFGN